MSFVISKIFWAVMAPGNLLFILCLIGAGMSMSRRRARQAVGAKLCMAVALIGLGFITLPIGDWLLLPLEGRGTAPARPDKVDGIILIGGAEDLQTTLGRQQPSARYGADRYLIFAQLAQQHPKAQLVFAGGSGAVFAQHAISEKDVAHDIFKELNIGQDRIVYEGKSRNTFENAHFATELVHPAPQQKWLLITGAFHMTRALAVFRKEGWNIYPAPADYLTSGALLAPTGFKLYDQLYKANQALHEYYGLIAYRLIGYTDTLWLDWH